MTVSVKSLPRAAQKPGANERILRGVGVGGGHRRKAGQSQGKSAMLSVTSA